MGIVADMNYESSGMYALTDETATPRRRWLILAGVAAIIVVLIAAFFMMRPAAKPAAGTGGTTASGAPADQMPTVSVGSPGSNSVDRMVSATGSLAARVDMPVGVAGEGGRVTAVLVQPGQWVAAGQTLATGDRSVQVQTASSLAASIAVAKSDADIALSEYNRAKALVDRGFISKADLERKAATSALNMEKYDELFDRVSELNAIAIEELQHFSQVLGLLRERGIPFGQAQPSPWIKGMMREVRKGRRFQVIDHLVVCALIEGRSCEKFQILAEAIRDLDPGLADFYAGLVESEGNHYATYLIMARHIDEAETARRLEFFLEIDGRLIVEGHPLAMLH